MPKVQLVPGLWGSLTPTQPLSGDQIEARADDLLRQLTLDEKIHQMSGDTPFLSGALEMMRASNTHPLPTGENLRLGIPGIRFSDGPRGVVMYHSTCFPVSMARGASWDVDLEERIGDAIGVEARAQGANYFGGVCINLLVLDQSFKEAERLKDEYVSTEHILISLVDEKGGKAAGILSSMGVTKDGLYNVLVSIRGNQRITDSNPEG